MVKSNSLAKERYPLKNERLRWIERKGGIIILNPLTGQYCRLNQVATYVWLKCNGTQTWGEIQIAVAREYGIRLSRVAEDILCLAGEFVRLGLIKIRRKNIHREIR
jgi:hypothetical protein